MSANRADKTRDRLRRIGARREELARRGDILKRDTIRALEEARGVVPVNEAAKLVRLGRATVYQDYIGADSPGSSNRRPVRS